MKNPNRFSFIKPEKSPFYYGYFIAIAGTIGVLASIPGQSAGVSPFTENIIASLGITRDQFSFAYGLGTLLSSLFLGVAGKWFDKYGARWISFFSVLGLIFSLFLFSNVDVITHHIMDIFSSPSVPTDQLVTNEHESQTTLFHSISELTVPFIVLTLLFFMLRYSGQGVLAMSSRNMIMKWFDTKRGRVNAFSSIFVSLGFSVSPLLIKEMIKMNSWQNTWIILALALSVIAVFVFVTFRDNPENHGLIPDGAKTFEDDTTSTQKSRKQYTLAEAVKTRAFWMYSTMLSFNSFFITGLTIHIESIYSNAGLDPDKAFRIFIPNTIVSVCVSAIANYLSDRLKLKTYLYLMISGGILAALGLAFLSLPFGVYMLIAGCGILGGFFAVLVAVTWPRFYGRKHLGAISGRTMSFIVAASAIAPALFSLFNTYLLSYAGIGWLSIILLIFVSFASRKANNPQ